MSKLRVRATVIAVLLCSALVGGATTARAAYPGSNGLIAFVRSGDIWTVSPSSHAQHRLTFTGNNSTPVWSPNGKLIAFTSSRAGSRDIWVMTATGTGLRRITMADTPETSPTWSPDGSWLAFSSARGSTHEFAIFKLRSTSPYGAAIRLTNPPPALDYPFDTYADSGPSWSALGGRIMFDRNWPCNPGEPSCNDLYRVPSAGGPVTQVLTETGAPTGYPVGDNWSVDMAPRGRAIAFTSDFDSAPYFFGPMNIYIAQADGSSAHRLTSDTDYDHPVFNGDAAWAPGGARVAYTRQLCSPDDCTASTPEVWTISATGTSARLVVRNASDPNWQPLP
jgi:Tol biopolymer transport system component